MGCEKRTEVEMKNQGTVSNSPLGSYEFFVEALRRGTYQAVMGEINNIANEAALHVKSAIKKAGAKVAMEMSQHMNLESRGREVIIKLEVPDICREDIVSALYKHYLSEE